MKLLHFFETKICRPVPLLVILLFVVLLRIPNFFEPYWYGDEGIYLTIGNGLRQGERLYAEIIDHKTPLIYYLAMVPHQRYFRLLLLGWMIATTILFYRLTKRLMTSSQGRFGATALFALFTTLPWFEGHIANGELFVMGFILAGAVLLLNTSLFDYFLTGTKKKLPRLTGREAGLLFMSAAVMSLGVLTKVPAILDVAAFFSLLWFVLVGALWQQKRQHVTDTFTQLILRGMILMTGLLTPIILSILYYWAIGSGDAYFQFGLLYNFRYAASWDPGVTHPFMIWYTSLLGKVSVVAATVVVVSVLYKKVSPSLALALTWFALAIMAATLSNRPYPHYFLQIIPPLALLLGLVMDALSSRSWQKKPLEVALSAGSASLAVGFFLFVLLQLNVGLYETQRYYVDFTQLMTGQLDYPAYRNSFNYLMEDNYRAADIIAQSQEEELFIWGTNPMLYALTKTSPTGRFTVSFHIHDFDAYEETFADLQREAPEFVVVMKNESTPLPGLQEYLLTEYIPHQNFTHFVLWKRQ